MIVRRIPVYYVVIPRGPQTSGSFSTAEAVALNPQPLPPWALGLLWQLVAAYARAPSRLAGGLTARAGIPDRRWLTPGERPEAGRNPDQALDHTLAALEKTDGEESA